MRMGGLFVFMWGFFAAIVLAFDVLLLDFFLAFSENASLGLDVIVFVGFFSFGKDWRFAGNICESNADGK